MLYPMAVVITWAPGVAASPVIYAHGFKPPTAVLKGMSSTLCATEVTFGQLRLSAAFCYRSVDALGWL